MYSTARRVRHPKADDEHAARTRRSAIKAPCLTPNPRPLRPALSTAAACKAHFWLLLLQSTKVTRPQARSAGRNEFEVLGLRLNLTYRRPHPALYPNRVAKWFQKSNSMKKLPAREPPKKTNLRIIPACSCSSSLAACWA